MIRFICGALALAACSLSVLAGTPRQDDAGSSPMRFARFDEGPADSCGANCRVLVAASGMISADTPKQFATFARAHDVRGATVVLNSKGGSVHGAIALGRIIRSLAMSTTIGRVKEIASRDHARRRGTLTPHGECQSMCPFVLLGGVRRSVPPESRVLVHQIWLGDRRDDAAAAQYSADDLVLVQRDIGRLVQYTADMGGGAELLELALRIPPWEPMRALSRDELRRAGLDTSADHVGQTLFDSAATTAAVPVNLGMRVDNSERGWLMAERAGRPTLVRQHPLTIEGDRIGTFEIALACSADTGRFDVSYSETRRSTGRASATLRQVDMWVDGQTSSLEIVSSRPGNTAHQLQTLATGTLPKSAMQSFADADADSVTVETESSINPTTVIRVGSSGFAQNFARLESACSGQQARRNTHARLTHARVESAGSEH